VQVKAFYYSRSTTVVEESDVADSASVSLSELQIALMRVLWLNGETSTADVASIMAKDRGLAHTTVATLLTRLEKRGVVAQRRDGRQLFYRAIVDESEVRRSMVADLIDSLFAGDANELVAHLVKESEIAPDDLARIRQRLAQGDRDEH
jgi:predicted transcriptional regulator